RSSTRPTASPAASPVCTRCCAARGCWRGPGASTRRKGSAPARRRRSTAYIAPTPTSTTTPSWPRTATSGYGPERHPVCGAPRQEYKDCGGRLPRWDMAFALKADESAAKGVKRLVRKQIRNAIESLTKPAGAKQEEAVHDARKRFKKVRALLRLVRPELGE